MAFLARFLSGLDRSARVLLGLVDRLEDRLLRRLDGGVGGVLGLSIGVAGRPIVRRLVGRRLDRRLGGGLRLRRGSPAARSSAAAASKAKARFMGVLRYAYRFVVWSALADITTAAPALDQARAVPRPQAVPDW